MGRHAGPDGLPARGDQAVLSLPASKGFLLAGGAALLAQHLTTRPTEDLDFFTAPNRGHVPAARDALEAAARRRGWATERIHDSDTFCRLVIRSDTAEVVTDLAVDTPPDFPASSTAAGPTLAPEELAGRKLLALFDRAAARDFADDEIPVPEGSSVAELRAFYAEWRSKLMKLSED
jgi:hypothetical protein